MSEASLKSQRNLSCSQEEVQSDTDKSVSQSESITDDMHMTEIHINDSSSAEILSHERNDEDGDDVDEGHQDAVMQNHSSNDRVHTVTEKISDPRTANPETSQNVKVILSTAAVSSALFCSKLLSFQTSGSNLFSFINHC